MITNTLTRNLLRNTSFYTLVGLSPSLTGLISLPITSRFLSPDEFWSIVLNCNIFDNDHDCGHTPNI